MTENRLRNFKNKGKDSTELRRRRTDVTIELRKTKRDEQMLKRRNISPNEVSPLKELNSQQITGQLPLDKIEEKLVLHQWGIDTQEIGIIKPIDEYLKSKDDKLMFEAAQISRKMLSKHKNPPIKDFIQSGLVPVFVGILDRFDNPSLQFEAAWVLTNIASGSTEETRVVVDTGAIPKFVKLLSSNEAQVSEQAVWALGNIAGDGPMLRNFVIAHGALGPLIRLINLDITLNFLKNVAWTLSNLCRNKNPPPEIDAVQQILPALAHLIRHTDKEVLSDTCWGLSYLTDGTNERIQLVINFGILPSLVNLLGHPEVTVQTPALRAVGNIVTGTDQQTQMVIEENALFFFRALLTHSKASVVKEAAWAMSNITAGPKEQIQAVIDTELVPLIVDVLKGKAGGRDFKSQKEAVWAVMNFTSSGTPQQIEYLIGCGVVEPMCKLLDSKDTKTVQVLLDGFNNILSNVSKNDVLMDTVCQQMDEHDGIAKIEGLQSHQNFEVYKAALALIDKYFSAESGEESQDVAPSATNEGFQFGPPQQVPMCGFQF